VVITEAYAESTKKAAQYDTAKWHEIHIIQCLAKNMDKEPSHPDVQAKRATGFYYDSFLHLFK